MQSMYYVGLDVHKKTISYCVKDVSGLIHLEGTFPPLEIAFCWLNPSISRSSTSAENSASF
jgi:hypothetical protein